MTTHPHPIHWHIYADSETVEAAVCARILQSAKTAIAARGEFHLVLAGGTTPRRVYQRLAIADADWSAWHIWLGDERCLPPDHPERNSRMAAEAWLDQVAIPRAQIHLIPAEQGAHAAARHYSEQLAGQDSFDLVLLGLGEDGHTASLFPGHDWGESTTAAPAIAVFDAPKPPPERVSLSAWRLAQTRALCFIVTGASKRQALQDWHTGIPAAAIHPAAGIDLYCDAAAGEGLR